MGRCSQSWRQRVVPQQRRARGADPEQLSPGTTKLHLSPTTGMRFGARWQILVWRSRSCCPGQNGAWGSSRMSAACCKLQSCLPEPTKSKAPHKPPSLTPRAWVAATPQEMGAGAPGGILQHPATSACCPDAHSLRARGRHRRPPQFLAVTALRAHPQTAAVSSRQGSGGCWC